MTCPSADGTADVCRLVLCEVPLPPLLQFSASEDPRAGHVPVSENFPENLLLPSEHLTVLVRTRRGSRWPSSPMNSQLPCYPQPHTHTVSPLPPLVSYVPMKTLALLPPFQLFSLRTYQLSQCQCGPGLAQPQGAYLVLRPLWRGSHVAMLWARYTLVLSSDPQSKAS